MGLNLFLKENLKELEQTGLLRNVSLVKGAQASRINIKGRDVLNFCSNNYLGLANDSRLVRSAQKSLEQEGCGSGASRLVCGNLLAHDSLEKRIAEFKGTERALLFSTGYMANIGIISSLFNQDDIIFSDRLNHASIVDGIILSQAKWRRYPHRDMKALEKMLKNSDGYKKRVIVTDSVFSMDGDIAPLDQIVALAQKYDCSVMIDEAHALGVLGEQGKGAVEHFRLEGQIDIQMGTLSKAVGSFGAYCCGSDALIRFLINKARSFIYTTGMPPHVAAASKRGLDIIEEDKLLRKRLWDNTHLFLKEVKGLGFNTLETETSIIPIVLGDAALAVTFSQKLLEKNIWVSAIRPPTVPKNTARLRVTLMATHSREDLEYLLGQLRDIGKELCCI